MCLVFILGIRVYCYIDFLIQSVIRNQICQHFQPFQYFCSKQQTYVSGKNDSGVEVQMFFMFLVFFGFPKPKILKLHFPDVAPPWTKVSKLFLVQMLPTFKHSCTFQILLSSTKLKFVSQLHNDGKQIVVLAVERLHQKNMKLLICTYFVLVEI